jgi:hypothetical protein
MGADLTRVHFLSMVQVTDPKGEHYERAFTLDDLAALEDGIVDLPVKLVVLDPVTSFAAGRDTSAGKDVRPMAQMIKDFAARHALAVLGITHSRKMAATNADDLICGSQEWSAVPRQTWHVYGDERDVIREWLPGKHNLSGRPPGYSYEICTIEKLLPITRTDGTVKDCKVTVPFIEFRSTNNRHANDPLEELMDREKRRRENSADAAKTLLLDQIDIEHGTPSVSIEAEAKRRGISERALRKAKKDLGLESKRVGKEWRLFFPSITLEKEPNGEDHN